MALYLGQLSKAGLWLPNAWYLSADMKVLFVSPFILSAEAKRPSISLRLSKTWSGILRLRSSWGIRVVLVSYFASFFVKASFTQGGWHWRQDVFLRSSSSSQEFYPHVFRTISYQSKGNVHIIYPPWRHSGDRISIHSYFRITSDINVDKSIFEIRRWWGYQLMAVVALGAPKSSHCWGSPLCRLHLWWARCCCRCRCCCFLLLSLLHHLCVMRKMSRRCFRWKTTTCGLRCCRQTSTLATPI